MAACLTLLALSYVISFKGQLLSLAFAYWLLTCQFIVIGFLGVGMIQSHIGCQTLLGDCYVDNYPLTLEFIKPSLTIGVVVWSIGAVLMSAYNLFTGLQVFLSPRSSNTVSANRSAQRQP